MTAAGERELVPRHEEERSGWYGAVHMYAPVFVKTPPWATHERLSNVRPDEKLLTNCCCCNMKADETTVVISYGPLPPHGLKGKERRAFLYYYDPTHHIECGPGFGCKANPRRLRGRHLRDRSAWG